MTTAEQNYRLLQEIEANRRFLLMAYQQNPKLLESAETRIRQLFEVAAPRWSDDLGKGGRAKQRGISLIELIMFIVIVSAALAGILLVMNTVTRSSADPLVHKQALAIAESLLEEVELMPFTYCDPDDASAVTAASPAGCTYPEALGPETIAGVTETRLGGAGVNAQFDNVSDYNGLNMAAGAVTDITGAAAVAGYAAGIAVANTALGVVPASESLRITVTVTGPDNVPVVLEGYRTRYAPGSVP